MMIVIDANIAVHFALAGPLRAIVIAHLSRWIDDDIGLLAPTLLASEATSTLTKLVHFGKLSDSDARNALRIISTLPIDLVPPTAELNLSAYHWTRRLNRVAAYDSFYLALAEQKNATLWTFDSKLVNAANQPWVKLLEA